MRYSLGMIEVVNIPAGMQAADAMMKASAVELVYAQPVCAGKYIAVVSGDVAAVEASVKAGLKTAGARLIDSVVIAGVHEQVPQAISACSDVGRVQAVGAMETFSLCAAVLVADAAVKAADVDLIEVRLGRGLGGKSFITMTGDVAAVEAAVKAGISVPEAQGLISGSVVIPSPHPGIVRTFI
ncbi:MAG: BMC domain-containing protein [Christensenella sp.]|uniref:BMC domain-containing protein n=1 Tax=Christensenella sp. TaxID=1935934 RepID=UPI002B2204FF|nr:BMC domain-containing protein [Christensenella sp.]MEA5003734.1 BMC domain-containing protein [Christensenella sp.]